MNNKDFQNGLTIGLASGGIVKQEYILPIGGDELGGVKNGGNVVINEDGTMTAPESTVSDEQVSSAVSDWLEANPEATTTVQDGSVGLSKLAFGTHNSDNGAFAYFTGDKIFGAQVYGVFGIIVPCRAGQTLYANFKLCTQIITDVRIMSAIPEKIYGALTNEIGALPANDDGVYTIPSDLTNTACAFFPTWFNAWNGQNFATEDEALEAMRSRYTTGAGGSGGRVQTQPFEDFPAWLHTSQSESFAVSSDKNIALYASLYKAVSPMVGANVCILGDSLTFQSAEDATPQGWTNGKYDGYGWYSRIARKYLQKFRYKGNEGCRWFGAISCIEDVKTVIAEGVVYDYIILEYGTNDITLGGIGDVTDVANENAETSIQAIRYCIESLQETFPTTRIIVIMPCMRNSNAKSTQNTYYEKVGAVLREYGVRMCNMAWDSGIAFNMMQGDGIHLRKLTYENGVIVDNTNDTEACARYSRCLEATMLMA